MVLLRVKETKVLDTLEDPGSSILSYRSQATRRVSLLLRPY
jgi:hypothetical protein